MLTEHERSSGWAWTGGLEARQGVGTQDWGSDPAEIPNPRSPDSRFGRETGKGVPDSRLGRNRESGAPVSRFGRERESGSRLAANREIGDTPLCEYSSRDPGLDVALSP